MAKLMQVIETEVTRGDGSESDPHRVSIQWWTTDGLKLAERDPWLVREIEAISNSVSLVGRASEGVTVTIPLPLIRALVLA